MERRLHAYENWLQPGNFVVRSQFGEFIGSIIRPLKFSL